MTSFKSIERNYQRMIVLIPGWAADYRIFQPLDIAFNYLLPRPLSIHDFEQRLLHFLNEQHIAKVSLLGVSLGGFLAYEFCARHRQLVDEAYLVSIRRQYPHDDIERVKEAVRKNKKAFLYSFYKQCFSGQKQDSVWFKNNLLKDYCETLSEATLIDGLDYLCQAEVKEKTLASLNNVTIIHGERDTVAPFSEAERLSRHLAKGRFVSIPQAGHFPFFNAAFRVS